ncbi:MULTISPECIES: hypothetical protein [unclassified Pseudovibrio]|uniref:hypothetical protein n=1 Tax=unclassified Pseudovibrio TaxID=2627060 RepID=UPI00187D4D27|nr:MULTISPECIES: hypothetical protein [unclassified Pseudovibrio]
MRNSASATVRFYWSACELNTIRNSFLTFRGELKAADLNSFCETSEYELGCAKRDLSAI